MINGYPTDEELRNRILNQLAWRGQERKYSKYYRHYTARYFVYSKDSMMSKLLCECGHVIHDHDLGLDYKARLISDKNFDDFFNWITNEIQEYVVSVQKGEADQWLLAKGFGKNYVNLGLDHGNVLHDHLYGEFLEKKKDVYECTQCGRLHIERENNNFISFFPKNGLFNALFKDEKLA